MFGKKCKKLFDIVLTILIIKVNDESYWRDIEKLNFFSLTVKLEISYQVVFSGDFLIELKMIDGFFLCVREHFFVIVPLF